MANYMKQYIHYGHTVFRKSDFEEIKNLPQFTKPLGGLWASPVDAERGWKDWCERERFGSCEERNSFRFRLRPWAKLLRLTEENIKDIPIIEDPPLLPGILTRRKPRRRIDFESLARKYDAIEVYIDELYIEYWDCDSLLVFNPEAIEEIDA